jgi:hypothetical protein
MPEPRPEKGTDSFLDYLHVGTCLSFADGSRRGIVEIVSEEP